MVEIVLRGAHPLSGLSVEGVGVSVRPLMGLALASVVSKPGRREALQSAFSAWGVTLPDAPRLAEGSTLAAFGTAPGAWLTSAQTVNPKWAAFLALQLDGLAAVADQSDAYVAVRIEGPQAQSILQRALPVDMHDKALPIGAGAVTIAAHIGIIVWRRGPQSFEVLAFRSYADSFWTWLVEISAGELHPA